MKKIKELAKNKIAQAALFIVIGLLGGWLFFSSPTPEAHNHDVAKASAEKQVWTCSMHPQIRKDEPGDCPICGMDLIPLRNSGGGSGGEVPENAMQMSEEAIALANVQTSMVSRKDPVKEILLYGVVAPDERNLQSQTAHVGGRIERLFVDFTGETVRKGETLATLYSPEVFTAQQELLEALKLKATQPQLVEAAREKLRLWKLTDEQIAKIETSGIVTPTVEIKSNTSGIVMSKRVSQGDYVSSGSVLFDVANLSKLWVMFEAYEVDLAFLRTGDKLSFSLQAIPGKVFNGTISFIDPILDKTTRTAKVRVEIANPNLEIKPEMYATATVTARLKQYNNQIVIPQSAVLWTGKRSIVYVSLSGYDTPVFQLREVELGPSLGDAYVVLSGLQDGEMIVSNGAFAIDASAQLEGKRSMMNDHTSKKMTGHEGHAMHGMEQSTQGKEKPTQGTEKPMLSTESAQQGHAMLTVEGNCEMCKERIEKAALSVNGVSSATWNATDKMLHLNFASGKTNLSAISKAIAKAGHDTEKDKADKKVYDALPGCCKYR
ncbi:efflux RND transporter periplasmic adaptor subunit [Bacteroides neonati]|uniref:efflux RND transporter periplasmic adaptor subunit n=1 Tax=Bacteroides neonati TaxID=1347393 RepID=UPI0004AE69D1|nr:efflux RND transporter periplasmic adaptor subunit [Bacteroides neonati]